MTIPAQAITEDPIVSAVIAWRNDSITLARIKPVLERLRVIRDLPCVFGGVPYICAREYNNRLCVHCAHRDIRAALFGEQPQGETDGTDRTDPDPDDGSEPAAG